MVGGGGEGVGDAFPFVALAVDGDSRCDLVRRGEHDQGAERIDQVGVDHHLWRLERRLLRSEEWREIPFRPCSGG